jgi:GT2 family glycosyltransferase
MNSASANPAIPVPSVSVIVLNYNGALWLERCLNSLREQTLFNDIEILVADNQSPDHSDQLAAALMKDWRNGRVIQHGENLGYCEGNNRAAESARGRYLLFLNNDTWLEPDCLERLLAEVALAQAAAATPLVLNYDDDSFQSLGAGGFDIFGLVTARGVFDTTREVLMPEGCSYLVEREIFNKVGRFDPKFFMFADETDLSWRVWIAGGKAVAVPAARLHHRGAAQVNPQGGGKLVELRTSDTKRFFANRNGLLVLLKNGQNLLLLLVPLQLLLLLAEAMAGLVLARRWSFVKRTFLDAVGDCWRLRAHIRTERQRIRSYRRRSDWWMLRFLRPGLNRFHELTRAWRIGRLTTTPDEKKTPS